MKKIILILITLSFILNANAQNKLTEYMTTPNQPRQIVLGYYYSAFVIVPAIAYNWYKPNRNKQGLMLSSGFDLKMLSQLNVNGLIRTSYLINKYEPYILYEYFHEIGFDRVATGCNYLLIDKKVSLLAGIGTSKICRDNEKIEPYTTLHIDNELRYLINDRISISYLGSTIYRKELSNAKQIMFNGYILFNFSF